MRVVIGQLSLDFDHPASLGVLPRVRGRLVFTDTPNNFKHELAQIEADERAGTPRHLGLSHNQESKP